MTYHTDGSISQIQETVSCKVRGAVPSTLHSRRVGARPAAACGSIEIAGPGSRCPSSPPSGPSTASPVNQGTRFTAGAYPAGGEVSTGRPAEQLGAGSIDGRDARVTSRAVMTECNLRQLLVARCSRAPRDTGAKHATWWRCSILAPRTRSPACRAHRPLRLAPSCCPCLCATGLSSASTYLFPHLYLLLNLPSSQNNTFLAQSQNHVFRQGQRGSAVRDGVYALIRPK